MELLKCKLCTCSGNFASTTSLATGHALDSGNLQSKSFSVVLFHLFIYFSIYLVILKSPTSGAAACHAGIAAVPFCFLSKMWSLWEGTEWEGRGEIFGRELPGGILVDATLEQSRSLHATILHQDCTLSKVHSSVITPLKKKRLEKEAVGAWNRKGDDGVKILSEQTLAGCAFPGTECVLIHQRGRASWVRVPAQPRSLRHPGLCCLSFPCGTRTLRLLRGKTPSILGALRGSLPT